MTRRAPLRADRKPRCHSSRPSDVTRCQVTRVGGFGRSAEMVIFGGMGGNGHFWGMVGNGHFWGSRIYGIYMENRGFAALFALYTILGSKEKTEKRYGRLRENAPNGAV